MPGLNLFTSNKLEILLAKLADRYVLIHQKNALIPETIIVQSLGMARWLSLRMADKIGICANLNYPFPNTFIDSVFESIIPEHDKQSYPNTDTNIWKIYNIIKENRPENEFGAVRMYLEDDSDGLKAYQLSTHLADLFDQYSIYRPEMVLNWDSNRPENWQAIIWSELLRNSDCDHRAILFKRFFDSVRTGSFNPKNLPDRISLFGVSFLPPIYINFFHELSNLIEIDFYVLNPCSEYWSDILSEKEAARFVGASGDSDISREDLHITVGNSLLASMGKQGRDFLFLTADFPIQPTFEQPGEDTLLHSIQSDILNLRNRGSDDNEPGEISAGDDSIRIHVCHSEMREIEVLHDQLLDHLEHDRSLKPRDIIVMAPDIERYTPFIQAVFGNPENREHHIPFTIADRGAKGESGVIKTFFEILDLIGGRYALSEIVSVLESEAVHSKFDLSIRDIELVSRWLTEVKVRWGRDAEHKRDLDLPRYEQNTWRFGLDRLILGYAMTGERERIYENIMPYDNIEGEQAIRLGKFLDFTDKLFEYLEKIQTDKTLPEWADCLASLCVDIFDSNDNTEYEIQNLLRKIRKLAMLSENSGFNRKVSHRIMKQYLSDQLGKHSSASGFIAGSVTFCSMLPMRSIPFKTICLIGMNNSAFPRQAKHYSFDLIANKPKLGDRSVRHTDRYLFLEAILSARQRLYISYTGQGVTDNNTIPPSVTVSELLDYIRDGYSLDGKPADQHIRTYHKLQAFSHDYYEPNSKLYSYSNENYLAAKSLLDSRVDIPEFFSDPLPAGDDNEKIVDLDGLCRFFANPSKYILNNRLGIYLDQSESALEDEEPYDLSGLDRFHLANDLLECRLRGEDIEKRLRLARCDGVLPHGAIGDILLGKINAATTPVVREIKKLTGGSPLPPIEIDIESGGYKITGIIDNIYKPGLINYKAWSISEKDRITGWLKLLALALMNIPEYPAKTILIGSEETLVLNKPDNPDLILSKLIRLYDIGRKRPLYFFPKTSFKYAGGIFKSGKVEQAIKSAAGKWYGSDYSRGEGQDPYYSRCFNSLNFADSDFRETAETVFIPMLEATEKIS